MNDATATVGMSVLSLYLNIFQPPYSAYILSIRRVKVDKYSDWQLGPCP